MELERILQRQGFGTRKGCRALIRSGRVAVNGEVCDDPFTDVCTDDLTFSVDEIAWPYREFATIMMNKPADYECSRRPIHHPSVLSLLPPPLVEREVQPIGRLDEDTTGLLILTDDGQLNHILSSPRKKVPKVYIATTKHPVDAGQIEAMLAGVVLHDDPEPVRAAACEVVGDCLLRLTITEGKYHQVKRMVAAAGNRVENLHRLSVGGLILPPDLKPGEWRWLEPSDIALLKAEE
ncbi:MAG: rRNA pseudouridine synthase [Rhodocyclaceae bacterium]|nr:rRNA pseudouridine synthase [Rhodocyclaceae bacterium]